MLEEIADIQFAGRGDAGMASGRPVDALRWHDASNALAAAPGGEHRLLLLAGIGGAAFFLAVMLSGIPESTGVGCFGAFGLFVTPMIVCPLLPAGGAGAFFAGWLIGFWGLLILGFVVLCICCWFFSSGPIPPWLLRL